MKCRCRTYSIVENVETSELNSVSVSIKYRICRNNIIYITIRVRSAFSLVASCVLLKYTRTDDVNWMAWSNLANLFCGSSHDFKLCYNIKRIDFIFLCFCTVIDHRWRHSVWRTKSHGTRPRLVHTFLFFTRHDVICDLLQYRRTQKWNLFVKFNKPLLTWPLHRLAICQFYRQLQSVNKLNFSISLGCKWSFADLFNFNLLKQLVANLWITSSNNKLATSLFTTSDKFVVNKLSQAVRDEGKE